MSLRRTTVAFGLAVLASVASIAVADDAKADAAVEKARKDVDEAVDKTASSAKKLNRKTKRGAKKAVKATGAAIERTGDKLEDAAR